MLTVRYDWLGVRAGDRVLDLGCGFGRHAYEAVRRGCRVTAVDYSLAELKDVSARFAELGAGSTTNGDAVHLPFADASFDRIIASEVLEHIDDDASAITELARVLRPGGTMAVTVPAWLSERICWALTDEYHAPFVDGGHVRVYTEHDLRRKLRAAGLKPGAAHHAHALHSPYWWLKCAVGVTNDEHPLVRAYNTVLLWDLYGRQPVARLTRLADRLANPLIGKSLVVYARRAA
ncbi:MAG: class I SAM-dependent methyltransferase [Acidimicrobiales bacterium]